jgi:hypothetical protein
MSRRIAPALAVTILAAGLSACGGGADAANNVAAAEPAADAAAAPEAATTNEAAAATPAAAAGPEAQYMLGKWSAMDEDCADTLDFRNDGKVTTPIGDANWTMSGDKLTIDYGDGSKPTTSTIKQLGADRIEVTTASGRSETQKRC